MKIQILNHALEWQGSLRDKNNWDLIDTTCYNVPLFLIRHGNPDEDRRYM